MSGLAAGALLLAGIWLSVITLAVLLLIRQLGLLTSRVDHVLQGVNARPGSAGLDIGSKIPAAVVSELPQLATDSGIVLTLSSTCTPCRYVAAELRDTRFPYGDEVFALVAGPEAAAQDVVAVLPPGLRIYRDPTATQIADLLQIEYAPFALVIQAGV